MKWWNLKYRICEIDLQKFIHLAIVAAMFAQIPITLEYLFAIQFIVFFCGISKNTWKNHQNNNFSFNWLNSDCVCAASHLNEHVQLFSLHAFDAIQFGFYSVLHENHLFFHCSFFYFIFSHSGFLSVSPFIWLRLRMWNFWIRLRNLHFFFNSIRQYLFDKIYSMNLFTSRTHMPHAGTQRAINNAVHLFILKLIH